MKKVTSDIHHRHRRIIELTNRWQDTTPEKHDEWLVDIWNRDVSRHDEVWHLGDFSFSHNYQTVADFTYKLNGNINLIKGNHDDQDILNKLKQDGLINNWWDYKEIKIDGTKVCLFHFPVTSWNQQHRGAWHLHGHCHGNLKNPQGKMLDVGLDSAYNLLGSHRFFTEEDIAEYMKTREIQVLDHHEERNATT